MNRFVILRNDDSDASRDCQHCVNLQEEESWLIFNRPLEMGEGGGTLQFLSFRYFTYNKSGALVG